MRPVFMKKITFQKYFCPLSQESVKKNLLFLYFSRCCNQRGYHLWGNCEGVLAVAPVVHSLMLFTNIKHLVCLYIGFRQPRKKDKWGRLLVNLSRYLVTRIIIPGEQPLVDIFLNYLSIIPWSGWILDSDWVLTGCRGVCYPVIMYTY